VRELMLQAIDSVPKVINSFTKPLSKTIENWSEESVEIRAELYWQILADDIKKNLGIS